MKKAMFAFAAFALLIVSVFAQHSGRVTAQAVPTPLPYTIYLPIVQTKAPPDELHIVDPSNGQPLRVFVQGDTPEDGTGGKPYGDFFGVFTPHDPYNILVALNYPMIQALMGKPAVQIDYQHQEAVGAVLFGYQRELVLKHITVEQVNAEAAKHELTVMYRIKSSGLYDAVYYHAAP